jgi:hypothetical protein
MNECVAIILRTGTIGVHLQTQSLFDEMVMLVIRSFRDTPAFPPCQNLFLIQTRNRERSERGQMMVTNAMRAKISKATLPYPVLAMKTSSTSPAYHDTSEQQSVMATKKA